LFAREGARVVVTTRKKVVEGRALVEDIRKEGREAIFIQFDVSVEEDWAEAIREVIKKYDKINILVNNAGVTSGKSILEVSLADWNRVMGINAGGVFLGTKYAILTMKDNGELCSIVNISSIDGIIGEAPLPAYCASKGAVRAFTKSVALACGEAGYTIRVNSVHPGYVLTEMTPEEANEAGFTLEQYLEKTGKLHPIGHIGKPIDIAYVNLYLASDESRWVTGSEFIVDGGYTAQ
jgi:NAD(P)-dependent dehydrogenase (short-subunit alcohol dehydrogenase family)